MHSWLLTTLRLACPVAAVGLPLLMLYGVLVPWQVAEDTLIEHRGSSKLLLGSSSYSAFQVQVVIETAGRLRLRERFRQSRRTPVADLRRLMT